MHGWPGGPGTRAAVDYACNFAVRRKTNHCSRCGFSFVPSPSPVTVTRGGKEATRVSGSDSAVPSLSGAQSGARERRGPQNRCADVYSLSVCSSRSRICSSSLLDGGARILPGDDAPLRCVFQGGVGKAVAVTARRNNAPTLPRPAGFSLRCQRRVRELSFRSPASVLLCLRRAVKVRGFCLEGAEQAGGPVVAWWLAQTRSSLGGDSLRRRALGQGRRSLGRVPDRWTFVVCFFYCGSSQSRAAIELLPAGGGGIQRIRLAVVPGTFM